MNIMDLYQPGMFDVGNEAQFAGGTVQPDLSQDMSLEEIIALMQQGSQSPVMPTPPEQPQGSYVPGDVSGFAGSGMQAPPLPDAMGQLGGLMGMMGKPQQQQPMQQQQPGGLMSYLQMLARG